MSSAQVGAVLRQIRKLATVRQDRELPDDQLLHRFAVHRDEARFAALLGRHGPMVLSVCRSVLHDLHDAEDAYQAAFLLLAQKAGSIHRREAVSGWLYRVAYHVAVRALASAARRRVLERRAVTMPSADPVLDLSLREVRAMLFEELEGMPDQYRSPLVLCGLEEKSLDEAARQLGWTRWTVKGRLQRGRELLRARLHRRGFELPAALAASALALGSASAQVSVTLAGSTLRAAVQVSGGRSVVAGVVSAEVAALVQGASKAMFPSKAKIATALLLIMSFAATAFGVARHQAAAADPPTPQQGQAEKSKAELQPEAAGTIEVRGQVLAPDAKPLAGAKLYLSNSTRNGLAGAERATSGPGGRFHFSVSRSEFSSDSEERLPSQVMAVAEGHGCDWTSVGSGEKELTLRLVKDVPISGRVLDPDGRPVAGAKLTVTGMSTVAGDDLGGYLEEARRGYGYAFAKNWRGPLPGSPAALTTGADGRFRLTGVGGERVVHFHVEGPGIASMDLADVMTRPAETVAGAQGRLIYGATFDCLGLATRPIEGVVHDQTTGKPLADVSVGHYLDRGRRVLTDRNGRYQLLGLPKARQYVLDVKPADGLYFQRRVRLLDTPGLGALTADIELSRGLTVRGRVTDQATGKPMAQARVEYYPLAGNTYVTRLTGLAKPCAAGTTGPDGSYVLTVLPGPGVLGVISPRPDAYMPAFVTLKERREFFKLSIVDLQGEDVLTTAGERPNSASGISQDAYHALVLLEPGENEEGLVQDVALEQAQTLKGRIVGPDGQPITGVTVLGLSRQSQETLKGSEFTVRGINPRASRPLVFYHKEKDLGFFVKELRGDPSGPVTVKLQPCGSLSGRVIDQDGQPVAGLRIEVTGKGLRILAESQVVTTDKEGRFRARGLVPGQEYSVLEPSPSGMRSRIYVKVTAEPGKNQDLGDINLPQDK